MHPITQVEEARVGGRTFAGTNATTEPEGSTDII